MAIEAQGYTLRAATREDFDAIVGLVRAADLVDWGSPDFTAAWLQHEWSFPQLDPASDTRLVERDGQVCAYAWQLGRAEHTELDGWGVVHPEHRGRGLGSMLVAWVEARAAEHAAVAPAGTADLRWGVAGPDRPAHELLERRGFELVRHFWKMEVHLDGPLPDPAPPPGIEIRPFDPGRDARTAHAVITEAFTSHFGWVARTFDEWAATNIELPSFDASLWFLATNGDETVGALAGTESEGSGFVDTLGVRPAWRGRGVGECLLRRSFAEFARRGLMDVSLDVDAGNATGAVALYERVGMHAARQYDTYLKRFEGAVATQSR